jgi:4-hydroxybenzoate polyprenyltransferase
METEIAERVDKIGVNTNASAGQLLNEVEERHRAYRTMILISLTHSMPTPNRLVSYSRFVKAEHTLFSLPLIFSGAVLAGGRWPSWRLSALILGAGFGARTAAFALNRMIDRHIDARNPRTANRELPQQTLKLADAWLILIAGTLIYLACAAAIAPICLYASPIPLLVFAVYPFLKRFTPLAHLGVGLADALAPLGGYVAVTAALHPIRPGLLLALFTFFWVSGFDIIYSTMDEAFDRREGLHSLPARYGSAKALQISTIFHLAAFGALALLYHTAVRTPLALVCLMAIGGLLYWEHHASHDVDLAFFKINAVLGFGVLLFVVSVIGRTA